MTATQIALSTDEAKTLKFILESYLSDLRMEIADTDRKDFRDNLKDREVFNKDMLTKL